MELNKPNTAGDKFMDEKVYKTMGRAGGLSIVLGVISIVVGLTSGILLLISAGRLLAGKSRIMF
jgi:hypothetical protein